LVIAAAGGVDHNALIQQVEKALTAAGWDLSAKAHPVERRSNVETNYQRATDFKLINRPTSQANILLGSQGIVAEDPRRFTMGILNTILGGGMSSRLFQEIREKRGLAYSVYSFNQGYSDGSVFGLYAGCSPKKAGEVTKLMLAELEKIAEHGVTEAELELAKGNITGGLALKFESSQARMSRLFAAELMNGQFMDLDTSLAAFNAVSLREVRDLAQAIAQKPRTLVAVGDLKESDFKGL